MYDKGLNVLTILLALLFELKLAMYCVFPGNKKLGYCFLKVNLLMLLFLLNEVHNISLKCEIPPLNGGNAEKKEIFFIQFEFLLDTITNTFVDKFFS